MAFLANTGTEITKVIVDVKGDGTKGIRTLAVRFGERNAAIAAVTYYISALALTPVTWFLHLVGVWFLPFVFVTNVGLVGSSILLLKDHSHENSRRIKKYVLLWFIFGLLAHIFGSLK